MTNDETREALDTARGRLIWVEQKLGGLRARLEVDFSELTQGLAEAKEMLAQLSASLDLQPLLWVREGLQVPSAMADRDKLKLMFGIPAERDGTPQGFTCDPSTSITYLTDGSFLVTFDEKRRTAASGGSSWVCADIPLPRPVKAAKISYDITFGAGWDWGASGKFPGLGRWVEGRPAGGGDVTPKNWSVRPCWEDYARDRVDFRFGPYTYSQDRRPWQQAGSDAWGQDYAGGTLRWAKPLAPNLLDAAMRTFHFEVQVRPEAGETITRVGRLTGSSAEPVAKTSVTGVAFVGPGQASDVTHCRFNFMYGGNDASYGPKVPVTMLKVSNFRVDELV